MISEDEFLLWREHPVTQWVLAAVVAGAEAQRAEWHRLSWEAGQADPLTLIELRTRADAYMALDETTYAQWRALNESADA